MKRAATSPGIGFRLAVDADAHQHEKVGGPASLSRSIVLAGVRSRYTLPRVQDSGAHVISVPVSIDLDFDIGPREALRAFERGRESAHRQLDELGSALAGPEGSIEDLLADLPAPQPARTPS